MKKVKVSVIVPVYNTCKYLRKCLNSIVNQTLKDIEIICVDDDSLDDSLEILNDFAKNDERFIIIPQKNQGVGIARNNALKIAKGKFISFIDSDDWIKENMFQELYYTASNLDCDIVNTNYISFLDETGKEKICNTIQHININSKLEIQEKKLYNSSMIKSIVFNNSHTAVWAKLFKTSFIRDNNILFSTKRFAEDIIFTVKSSLSASKICNLNSAFYYYRLRNDSLFNSVSENKMDIFHHFNEIKTFLEQKELAQDFKKDFEDFIIKHAVANYQNIPDKLKSKYKEECKDILSSKKYKEFLNVAENNGCSFIESLFSIKNEHNSLGKKRKIITIIGIKIRLGEFK